MKNLFKTMMLVAVAAMGFTACSNEAFEEVNPAVESKTYTMTFVADAPNTRTSVLIDEVNKKANYSWSPGDKVGFYYVATDANYKKKGNSTAVIADNGSATFTPSFEPAKDKENVITTNYNIGAFYPSDSWVSHSDTNPFNNVKVKISGAQTLTKDTFDPKADLMMAKPFMDIALDNETVKKLEFTRIAAVGKMNLKLENMENGEVIKEVVFTLAENPHFNGNAMLDLENSSYSLVEDETTNAVTLTGELAANAERTAIFFTCFPGEYIGAYTIEVTTDKATYSKTGTLSEDKPLSFTAGNVLSFNATVGNRYVEVVEEGSTVDVLNREFTGVPKGTNYKEWKDMSGESGAIYAGQSAGGNSSIQLRSDNSNSGIITTTSGGYAKKVVVDWNAGTVNGRTLNIYGKNTAYTAATDLYDTNKQGTLLGTIKMGTSTELEIDGDYEYIGMCSSSNAMYINEIKITWGPGDPREAQTLTFAPNEYNVIFGDEFKAPTVTGVQTTVTYTSSEESVATVDANTGAVTILATGTTTITATAAENETYKAGSASYTLTVSAAPSGNEVTTTYTFSKYTAGAQYAKNEVHKLDDVLTITTTQCHFTTELRIYGSSDHDGIAIGQLTKGTKIKSLGFNMGYKADKLVVYGSSNGSTWTQVGTLTTTSAYKDYTLDFGNTSYTYFKLDATAAQIRIKTLTLTYE